MFVRQGLHMRLGFEADIIVVGEASSSAEALVLSQMVRPNVVIMDQVLPGPDLLAAVASLWAAYPECALVILSLYDEPLMQVQAQAAGTITFVGKREGVKVLLEAIRRASKQCVQSRQK
jgi:DNA-binding NarL/FixJ family response regulator